MKLRQFLSEMNESKTEELAQKAALKVKIIKRFNEDRMVTLDELKTLAKGSNVDYDEVVETMCDIFQSLLYRRKEKRDIKVDATELEMGIKHELEHTKDKGIAEVIAKDHLAEVPNYYTLLKEIDND